MYPETFLMKILLKLEIFSLEICKIVVLIEKCVDLDQTGNFQFDYDFKKV